MDGWACDIIAVYSRLRTDILKWYTIATAILHMHPHAMMTAFTVGVFSFH